jgi:hypothetical protein
MIRPTGSVTLATIMAACVLGAGGFLLGKGSEPPKVPAAVSVQAIEQPASPDPIALPPAVRLPRR